MAGSIKGITIEIGGNTTKLSQALKQPAKEVRELRSELSNVDKALRFDTSNVDLLNQKQRVLTQTIGATEKELTILKEAQKQYIESGKNLDSKEYIELEAKIGVVSKALENLKNQQNAFNGTVQAMGIKLGEFGDKATRVGTKLTSTVTAGVGAIAGLSQAAWAELDQAYDYIAAGTGATGDALKDLKNSFDNVYGSFPADSQDVGAAIADINTRFGLTGELLEQASEQFLMFADVNGTDVSGSIESVAKAMADAGIETKDLNIVLDKLTVASQASGLSVDSIADALSKNGVAMRELGYDTDEMIALLTTFEKRGVDTSTVLTGMKNAFKTYAKEGKDAKSELASFFHAIEEGSVTAADAQEIFGAKAGAALYQYAKEGKLNLQEMMDVINSSSGGLEATFNEMLDPADKAKIALNSLKVAGADLGASIQDVIAPLIEKLVEKVKELTAWFTSLDDSQKELIVKIGLLVAAVGPAILVIGKLATGVSSLISFFGSAATWGGKLMQAISGIAGGASIGVAGLLGIVAAVAAVAGAFISLWKNSEEFRSKMIAIWDGIVQKVQEFCQGIVDRINELGFEFEDITEVISAIWKEFCDFMAPIFEGAWSIIATIIETTLDVITGILDVFIGIFTGDWEKFTTGIQEIWDGLWSGLGNILQTCVDTIVKCIEEFLSWFGIEWDLGWISDAWSECWSFVSGFVEKTLGVVSSIIGGFISLLTGDWDGFCEGISNAWNGLWQGVSDFVHFIWDGICSFFSGIFGWLFGETEETTEEIGGFWSGLWEGVKATTEFVWGLIKGILEGVWNTICGLASTIFEGAKGLLSFFGGLWDGIQSGASEAWDKITGVLSSAWNGICDIANDIFGGIGDFFSGIWNSITGGAADTGDGVTQAWEDVNVASESELTALAAATEKTWKQIKETTAKYLKATQETVDKASQNIAALINSLMDGANKKVTSGLKEIESLEKKAVQSIKSDISSAIKSIQSSVKSGLSETSRQVRSSTSDIQSAVSKAWESINSVTRSVWGSFSNCIIPQINATRNQAVQIFNDLYAQIARSMQNTVSIVENSANRMRSAFNFSFTIPRIPMPHFAISPSNWNMGDLLKGSIPSLSLQWYAKAMTNGMILDKPTIFGTDGTSLLAGGEAGKEVVVGLSSLENMIDNSITRALAGKLEAIRQSQVQEDRQSLKIDYEKLSSAMIAGLSGISVNNTFAIGSRQVANELMPLIDAGLEKRKRMR